ncbi:MAG: hypothetical protein EBY18_15990 [Alphaproteobacteria bacterium]|nr:hypothetical protein [Alphaproteobacteria bacterium]
MRPLSKSILAAAVAAGLAAAPAAARVGVTSVADGEPLGQPPAEAERILRVGIDVQASERVTTKANDRAHVVFLDGTALTVGPNSVLVIDKYVYDPNRKTGDMALSTTKGVFRFVGGSISKNSEVVVTTPSATIGIRGGIATIEVADGGSTRATFIYGDSLRVTNQGVTQTATRNGSQITASAGEKPTPPAILPPGRMPATQPFERTASPAPAGTAPRNVIADAQQQVQQQAVQQQFLQQQAIQQQPATAPATPATTPLATQVTPVTTTAPIRPTLASIDTALDQSGLTRNNSRVAPGQMQIASRFDPRGPAQRGSGPEGQSTPPPRQPTKAGPPGGPQGPPKPPASIAKPQQTNAIRAAVAPQGNIGKVQTNVNRGNQK